MHTFYTYMNTHLYTYKHTHTQKNYGYLLNLLSCDISSGSTIQQLWWLLHLYSLLLSTKKSVCPSFPTNELQWDPHRLPGPLTLYILYTIKHHILPRKTLLPRQHLLRPRQTRLTHQKKKRQTRFSKYGVVRETLKSLRRRFNHKSRRGLLRIRDQRQ